MVESSRPGEFQPDPGESNSHAQDTVGKILSDPSFESTSKIRTWTGVALFLSGAVSILFAIAATYYGLDRVELLVEGTNDRAIAIIKIVGHTVVSVALVFFGYALIRAGERMFVPRWLLLGDPKDVDIIRAILGNDSPLGTAVKSTERIGTAIGKVVEPIARGLKKD